MNNTLFRLVYVSQNDIEGDDATVRAEVETILRVARRKNAAADVTGALMFNATNFAQVLEGGHDDLQATFEHIQCDTRHSNVVILTFEPTTERRFTGWSMAEVAEDAVTAEFAALRPGVAFDIERLSGECILELLLAQAGATQRA